MACDGLKSCGREKLRGNGVRKKIERLRKEKSDTLDRGRFRRDPLDCNIEYGAG